MEREVGFYLLERALIDRGLKEEQLHQMQLGYITQRILETFDFYFDHDLMRALENFYHFCRYDLWVMEASDAEEELDGAADYSIIAYAGCYTAFFYHY